MPPASRRGPSAPPDWSYERDHVVADDALWDSTTRHFDAEGLAQWNRTQKPRWLRWNARATPTQRRTITALRVRVKPMARPTELPACVSTLTALRSLSMPLSIASSLHADSLPPRIEVLRFDETGSGRAAITSELVLPKVTHLSSVTGELRFTHHSFPALRDAALKIGPRSPMLAELAAIRSLESLLVVGPMRTTELEAFARLRVLGLASSPLVSLDGIESLRALESLSIKRMPKLRDLAALARLPKLRSVTILGANALEDLRPLLAIPKLKRLHISHSKRIRLADVADALIAKRLAHLAITGKRHLYPDGEGGWMRETR